LGILGCTMEGGTENKAKRVGKDVHSVVAVNAGTGSKGEAGKKLRVHVQRFFKKKESRKELIR